MVVGISAGGRANGETAKMVKAVLAATEGETEFIYLGDKYISGCRGCLACAKTGKCVIKDDWAEIAQKLMDADGIVFGAPSYGGNINAIGHAFLERTYSLRHHRFFLGGKYMVVVSPNTAGGSAEMYIKQMADTNRMVVVDTVCGENGKPPCLFCGEGHKCFSGWAVRANGEDILDEITPDMIPPLFEEQKKAQIHARRAGWELSRMIKHRK